jgi:hypothetical protein
MRKPLYIVTDRPDYNIRSGHVARTPAQQLEYEVRAYEAQPDPDRLLWKPTGRREMGKGILGHIAQLEEERRLVYQPQGSWRHEYRWRDTRSVLAIFMRAVGLR